MVREWLSKYSVENNQQRSSLRGVNESCEASVLRATEEPLHSRRLWGEEHGKNGGLRKMSREDCVECAICWVEQSFLSGEQCSVKARFNWVRTLLRQHITLPRVRTLFKGDLIMWKIREKNHTTLQHGGLIERSIGSYAAGLCWEYYWLNSYLVHKIRWESMCRECVQKNRQGLLEWWFWRVTMFFRVGTWT